MVTWKDKVGPWLSAFGAIVCGVAGNVTAVLFAVALTFAWLYIVKLKRQLQWLNGEGE